MKSPLPYLLGTSFRSWVSAKGFWLVVVAALLPMVLTGAWAATHRDDIAVSAVRFDESTLVDGNNVSFTGVFTNPGAGTVRDFNVSVAIGRVVGNQLFATASQDERIESLEPGATREVTVRWNATPGLYYVVATADIEDEVGEIDEYNNQVPEPVSVRNKPPAEQDAPRRTNATEGAENATARVDLRVRDLAAPQDAQPGDATRVRVTVENAGEADVTNATLTLSVGRSFQGTLLPSQSQTFGVDLAAGASKSFELPWTAASGSWWAVAEVIPPADTGEDAPEDNQLATGFTVDLVITEDFKPPPFPEKLTIKEFYIDVLSLLHLRVLLPLVALFYAAGVLTEERERGSLAYMLTRPIPRPLIPITKFAASFALAAVASMIGLVLTYLLLFQTMPDAQDIGFLSTPVLAALVALFVYGAIFTLMGTLVDRPYLIGAAFVLGWENAASIFLPWVANFTVTQHIGNALGGDPDVATDGWLLDRGLMWVPEGEIALRALYILLAVGVGALIASGVAMRRREFAV